MLVVEEKGKVKKKETVRMLGRMNGRMVVVSIHPGGEEEEGVELTLLGGEKGR